jgi:hypothetical protein
MESRSLRRRSPVPPPPTVSTRGRPRKKVGRPPKARPPPEEEEVDDDDVPLLELKVVQEKRAARATRRSKTEKEDDEKPARRSGRRRNSMQSNVSSEAAHSDEDDEDNQGDDEEEKRTRRSIRRRSSLQSTASAQSNGSLEDDAKEDDEAEVEKEEVPTVPDVAMESEKQSLQEDVDAPPKEKSIVDLPQNTVAIESSPKEEKAPETVSTATAHPDDDRPNPALHDDDLVCQEDESALEYPMTMASFRAFREPLDKTTLPLPKSDVLSTVAMTIVKEAPVQKDMLVTPAAVTAAPNDIPATIDSTLIVASTQMVVETTEEEPLSSVEIVKANDCPPFTSPPDTSDKVPESMAATTHAPTHNMEQRAGMEKPIFLDEDKELVSEIAPASLEQTVNTDNDTFPSSPDSAIVLPKVVDAAEKNDTVEREDVTSMETVSSNGVICPEPDEPTENVSNVDPTSAISAAGPILNREVPVEPAAPIVNETREDMQPMDETPMTEPPPQEEQGGTPMDVEETLVPVADSDPTSTPPETILETDASAVSTIPADADLSKKRSIDELSAVSQWKRFRALSSIPEPLPTEPIRRLSIVKTKLCIYTKGRQVHLAALNYDEMFLGYWNALTRRLEGDMAAECEVILNSFLKTKCLRKLHNRIILGELNASAMVIFQSPLFDSSLHCLLDIRIDAA